MDRIRPTIRKIAEEIGVSPATVSLVLNDRPGVKEETRARIAQVLEQNGYQIRKHVITRRIQYVCYQKTGWFSERPDSFYTYVMKGIATGCRKHGAELQVSYASEKTISDVMHQAETGAEGIVLLGTEFSHDSPLPFDEPGIPVVIIDHPFLGEAVNSIFPNDYTGIGEAVKHLKELGHTRIGYVTLQGTFGELFTREHIWRNVMEVNHLAVREEHVLRLSTCVADAQMQFEQYLDVTDDLPTAFLTVNDVLGSAVIGVLARKGLRVPEDVSVIGYDNTGLCELTVPNLSSVNTDIPEMGKLAVDRIFHMINEKDASAIKIMTTAHLVLRDSTGQARDQRPY